MDQTLFTVDEDVGESPGIVIPGVVLSQNFEK